MSRPDRPCEAVAAVQQTCEPPQFLKCGITSRANSVIRPFRVSLANHTKVDLQRSGLETAYLLVIGD